MIGGEVTFLTTGSHGLIYHMKINQSEYCIKIIPFAQIFGNILDNTRPENVEYRFHELCNNFLLFKISPHFKKYIASLQGRGIPKLLDEVSDQETKFIESHRHTDYSITIITEWVEGLSISNFMLHSRIEDEMMWKRIFFQVLYSLTCLQEVFEGFRHNDLFCRNVIIGILKDPKRVRYALFDNHFELLNTHHIYITDFDFACSNQIQNKKLALEEYKYLNLDKPNPYYDWNTFLNNLIFYHKKNLPEDFRNKYIYPQLPSNLRGESPDYRMLEEIILTYPRQILESDLYREFRVSPAEHSNTWSLTEQKKMLLDTKLLSK
jgi:hypothetical protein